MKVHHTMFIMVRNNDADDYINPLNGSPLSYEITFLGSSETGMKLFIENIV